MFIKMFIKMNTKKITMKCLILVLTLCLTGITMGTNINVAAAEPHPFATALQQFIADAGGQAVAFLVNADGAGTEAMLAIDYSEFPHGTLFFLYGGILVAEDVGPQDAGFVTSVTVRDNRAVNAMADGGSMSYTLFEIEGGRLVETLIIFSEMSDGQTNNYYYGGWGGQSITGQEFNDILIRYGMDNLRGPWWDLQDESAVILAKTLAGTIEQTIEQTIEPQPIQSQVDPIGPIGPTDPTIRLVIGSTQYTHRGAIRTAEVAPFISEGRTMVPLAIVTEALGGQVSWNEVTRTVTITADGISFELVVGRSLPGGMGTPVIVDGRTFVPVSYVSDMLGATVRWDGDNSAVYIY